MSLIKIYDRDELLEISFDDVRKYHGSVALMAVAVGYRVVGAALEALYGENPPKRSQISVTAGHAGPGFRDAFEFVTRAFTRGNYQVDVHYPKGQYDPYRATSYAFVVSDISGKAVEVVMSEDFLPAIFYTYLKLEREQAMTPEEVLLYEEMKKELSARALQLPTEQLLTVRSVTK